jgi:hypothetical protein
MARMCCIGCGGARLTLGGRDHTIADATGREWTFEMHPYCGPIVLLKNGDPKPKQPGSRSPFWDALEAWQASKKEAA